MILVDYKNMRTANTFGAWARAEGLGLRDMIVARKSWDTAVEEAWSVAEDVINDQSAEIARLMRELEQTKNLLRTSGGKTNG